MARYDDIDPQDIDPETNRPYAGYSSPALDTSFHDHEMDVDDDPVDQVRELLLEWKCSCTDGFYLQRSRIDPRRHRGFGEWIACTRCGGSGLDPRAAKALALMPSDGQEQSDHDFFGSSEDDDACTDRRGHKWVCRDDDEEISYCERCGADGNG